VRTAGRVTAILASIVVAVLGAFALVPAPPGYADGDPASDVLIGENVFYPYSPAVSTSLQRTLDAETATAGRAHFPIKVALIHAPTDLGAIPILFGNPKAYADFLDQEISFASMKQLLLVVMPSGYGVQGLGLAATHAAASLRLPGGATSDDLARAAIVAVRKLAAAAGHPIGSVAPTDTQGQEGGRERTVADPRELAGSNGGAPVLYAVALFVIVLASVGAILALRWRRTSTR
jgi:hypothetical protein